MNPDPLERLPGESKRAQAAFISYALLGSGRSLRKLLAEFKQAERAPTRAWESLCSWSTKYSWVERAARFDTQQREKALAEYEAQWKEKIMCASEVLGRLSEQGRVSIADFIVKTLEPILDQEGQPTGETLERIGVNWDAIQKNGHLIKSLTSTAYGPKIELYDGQAALVNVGRHYKLFTDQQNVSGSLALTFCADDLAAAKTRAEAAEKKLLENDSA